MTDKQISNLPQALTIYPSDLFVLEQSGVAKNLTGQLLVSWLTNYADGHGGIVSIEKTSTAGLIDTYTITYADTSTDTFTVTNGAKGDTGAQTYVWIKYATTYPTSAGDMGDNPSNYIGIYVGTLPGAPALPSYYTWYQWKGAQGDPATISTYAIEYMESTSGTVVPSGSWTTTIPSVTNGNFLWTRVTVTYSDGTDVVSYSVSRDGVNGDGAVSTVNNVDPDSNGNVTLTASDIATSDNTSIQAHLNALENHGWTTVWTNSNTNADFAAQTVAIDLSGYNEFYLHFCMKSATPDSSDTVLVGCGIKNTEFVASGVMGNYIRRRSYTITDTGVSFTTGGYISSYGSTTSNGANHMIPYHIFAR